MHYTQYFADHVDLLQQFKHAIVKLPPYQISLSDLSEEDQQFMTTVDTLCKAKINDDAFYAQGQWLVDRIVMRYEHLLPYLSRDLLWFFGGNSLHHMSDEEIQFYQQLDELRHAAESQNREFNILEAKRFLMEQQQNDSPNSEH